MMQVYRYFGLNGLVLFQSILSLNVRCTLRWDSAPWRKPSQLSLQHSSSPPWSCQHHGVVGHWPPFSGGQTWRRSCSLGLGPGRSQGHHVLWLRPGVDRRVMTERKNIWVSGWIFHLQPVSSAGWVSDEGISGSNAGTEGHDDIFT